MSIHSWLERKVFWHPCFEGKVFFFNYRFMLFLLLFMQSLNYFEELFHFWSYIISSLLLSFKIFSFRLNLKGNEKVYASGFCLDNECWRLYEQKVHDVLTQGMRDRVKSIRVMWRNLPAECSIENVWKALYIIIWFERFVIYSWCVLKLVCDAGLFNI